MFLKQIGKYLIKSDIPQKSDAVIVLMGNIPDRVLETYDLFRTGHTKQIIIVEENMGSDVILEERGIHLISNTQQCRSILVKLGIPSNNIICIPGNARSTQEEALLTRAYLQTRPEISSLTIVTSSIHSRRANIIFKNAFRKKELSVRVYSCPSKYSVFNEKEWWKKKNDTQSILLEYIKILNFLVFEIHRL